MTSTPVSTDSWQIASAAAKSHRQSSIDRVHPSPPPLPPRLPLNVSKLPSELLPSSECEITEAPPETLLRRLASGELSSEQVVVAFLRRAALAQGLANCITELLPDKAVARARQLDAYFQTHRRPSGPLHGLPISLKEMLPIKGLGVDGGYCALYGTEASSNSLIVDCLHDAGCVFYARTTQPQTLMHLETDNNLYGTTVNPRNRNLTAGGSSGGEGALLGLRGSCIGMGTDIGGSIRSPAANNGVFGLRPTHSRLPIGFERPLLSGMEAVPCVVGPMSTSLFGVEVVMKSILDQKPWLREPMLTPMPWRTSEEVGPKSLKVGLLVDDGVVRPHPPILRALREVGERMKAAGIEVVDFEPYRHDRAWEIIASLYFPDGGKMDADLIADSGEPWLSLSKWIIEDNPHVQLLTHEQLWDLTIQRDRYRGEYAKHWLQSGKTTGGSPVDVVLCPTGPGVAPPLECARYWAYTSQWNLLDYPALVFPAGEVNEADVSDTLADYKPRNDADEYNKSLWTDDARRYLEQPISLQLVGGRFDDELVVNACKIIGECLRSKAD